MNEQTKSEDRLKPGDVVCALPTYPGSAWGPNDVGIIQHQESDAEAQYDDRRWMILWIRGEFTSPKPMLHPRSESKLKKLPPEQAALILLGSV